MLNKCVELGYEGDYALKCIEANKHNSVTATYNLLLKKAIREGEISIKDAYECKTDIIHLLRRNPRFRKINDKVHKFFHFDKNRKSNSLQPKGFITETKPEKSKSEVRNEYMTIQKEQDLDSKARNTEDRKQTINTAAPSLLGVGKKQNIRNDSSNKPPRFSNIKNKNRSIKNPPFLDNINIISPNGIPKKAATSKYRGSRRMKSNDSKNSHSSKHENTINTQELAQFFEQRIAKKDGCRKNHKFKNATALLDYNNSNQNFGAKTNLNNTVILDSSYRSGSRKRDSRKTRISLGNHSILANSELMPISQQKLMDMVTASNNAKKLESAYYPMKLKRDFMTNSKLINRLQKFPGMLNLSSKHKRHRTKSKGKSPQNIKAHHNLYVAYIKGNSRRIKPISKYQHFHPGNKTVVAKHIFENSNSALKGEHSRKNSHGVPDSLFRQT